MKRGPEYSDSQRKKLVGEHLRNADKLLKSGEYDQALAEVEQGLELEPGNFYAQAYKERITALRDKHSKPGEHPAPPSDKTRGHDGAGPKSGLGARPPAPAPEPPMDELSEVTGARIEEIEGDDAGDDRAAAPPLPPPVQAVGDETVPPGRDIAGLKQQLERERATHEDETTRQAEELARRALEGELREREESDRLRNAEQLATAEALAGAPAEALRQVVDGAARSFERMLEAGDLDGAFRQLAAISIVDPENSELAGMAGRLDGATLAALPSHGAEPETGSREIPLQWYARILRSAWGEGAPNGAQAGAVAEAKHRFRVTAEEEGRLLQEIRRDIVAEAVKEAFRNGEPDAESNSFLESLARELSVGDLETLKAGAGK